MAGQFTDRIADLCGRTARVLEEVAEKLDEADLSEWAGTLRGLAKQHADLAHDCLVETQPVDPSRYNLRERFKRTIEELHELAADLLARTKPGHEQVSEAAEILEEALEFHEP